jgi:hypothetical protein
MYTIISKRLVSVNSTQQICLMGSFSRLETAKAQMYKNNTQLLCRGLFYSSEIIYFIFFHRKDQECSMLENRAMITMRYNVCNNYDEEITKLSNYKTRTHLKFR